MNENEEADERQNLVATLREQAGLSPIQLAAKAGVPVSAVRRMEHRRLARMADALAVATALGKPAAQVFEPAFQIIGRRGVKTDEELMDLAWEDAEFRRELAKVGIDLHPAYWALKVQFVGGGTRCWPLFSSEVDRRGVLVVLSGNAHLDVG